MDLRRCVSLVLFVPKASSKLLDLDSRGNKVLSVNSP